MKIIQTYKSENERHEITVERFIELTEESGYWKPGTALSTLIDAGMLQTPFSYFEIRYEKISCK